MLIYLWLLQLPYGYLTPEAPQLLKDYYVNVVNWVDKSATYVVGEDEKDNMPGYLTLTSAFQKLDWKVEEGFRCLDERIDERMDKIEARVAYLEKKIPDGRKMEFNVVSRLCTIFGHELATFKWKINKELREEFNLQPPNDGPPRVRREAVMEFLRTRNLSMRLRLKCHYLLLSILQRSFHATP
ncbi:hypothetical protein LIER_02248 [Lithospermum erythrorhizon]|uniref:Terpene synthase metal-binding domain-containing protein n=1 Tax=Lithospermum erythrorhizon TaxID=34254 RepID=A0AAV3NR80_LITER